MDFIVEVSARHVHLTQEHVEALFGKGHELTFDRPLSQPGQFLSKEKVTIKNAIAKLSVFQSLDPFAKHPRLKFQKPTALLCVQRASFARAAILQALRLLKSKVPKEAFSFRKVLSLQNAIFT